LNTHAHQSPGQSSNHATASLFRAGIYNLHYVSSTQNLRRYYVASPDLLQIHYAAVSAIRPPQPGRSIRTGPLCSYNPDHCTLHSVPWVASLTNIPSPWSTIIRHSSHITTHGTPLRAQSSSSITLRNRAHLARCARYLGALRLRRCPVPPLRYCPATYSVCVTPKNQSHLQHLYQDQPPRSAPCRNLQPPLRSGFRYPPSAARGGTTISQLQKHHTQAPTIPIQTPNLLPRKYL